MLAVLLSAPSLWMAFVSHQISTDTALIRLLIAIPVAGVLLGVLRLVTDHRPVRPMKQDETMGS
jgi:hypothetical protein